MNQALARVPWSASPVNGFEDAAGSVVTFVTFVGRRGRETLKYYYSAADIFVTVPWYEPFGITPVEAMAHRLKTLAGRALYALRKQTPEPVFGIIKSALGIETEGYVHQLHFYYPKSGGFEELPRAFEAHVKDRVGRVTEQWMFRDFGRVT